MIVRKTMYQIFSLFQKACHNESKNILYSLNGYGENKPFIAIFYNLVLDFDVFKLF